MISSITNFRHFLIPITIICLVCVSTLKVSAGWVEEVIESLKYYETADPVSDAERAAKKSEYYFYEVYGFAAIVPSVDYWVIEKCVNGDIKIRGIDGTSDVLYSDEHTRLDHIARDYAAKFNLRMHQLLIANRQLPCFSEQKNPAKDVLQSKQTK